MAAVMEVLKMSQDTSQAVLNFIAQLNAAARQCCFTVECKCSKKVDFRDIIVVGVIDVDLQNDEIRLDFG